MRSSAVMLKKVKGSLFYEPLYVFKGSEWSSDRSPLSHVPSLQPSGVCLKEDSCKYVRWPTPRRDCCQFRQWNAISLYWLENPMMLEEWKGTQGSEIFKAKLIHLCQMLMISWRTAFLIENPRRCSVSFVTSKTNLPVHRHDTYLGTPWTKCWIRYH